MKWRRRAAWLGGRLSLSLISLSVTLVVLELVVRAAYPQQLTQLRPDIWVPVPVWGYRHAANVDTTVNTGERSVHFVTDANGHRISDQAPSVQDAEFKIMVAGDSYVVAMQVDYADTLPARLEASLTDQWGMTVSALNVGVLGWTPYQYYAEIDAQLARESFDLVVVFIYLLNDIEDMHWAFPIQYPPLENTVSRPLRWPRKLDRHELKYGVLFPVDVFLRENSQLYVLMRHAALQPLWARFGYDVDLFSGTVYKSKANGPWWGNAAAICAQIAARAALDSTPTLFVLLPGWYQIDEPGFRQARRLYGIDGDLIDLEQPNRIFLAEMEVHDLAVVDATPALKAAWEAGSRDLYGTVDRHLAPEGYRVVTEMVVEWLQTNGLPSVGTTLVPANSAE